MLNNTHDDISSENIQPSFTTKGVKGLSVHAYMYVTIKGMEVERGLYFRLAVVTKKAVYM